MINLWELPKRKNYNFVIRSSKKVIYLDQFKVYSLKNSWAITVINMIWSDSDHISNSLVLVPMPYFNKYIVNIHNSRQRASSWHFWYLTVFKNLKKSSIFASKVKINIFMDCPYFKKGWFQPLRSSCNHLCTHFSMYFHIFQFVEHFGICMYVLFCKYVGRVGMCQDFTRLIVRLSQALARLSHTQKQKL